MGGLNEQTLEKPKRSDKSGATAKLGKYRMHENAGEVHFHDDEKKLKTAVPVSVWWKAWNAMQQGQQKEFFYLDAENKSQLTVKLVGLSEHKPDVDVVITKIAPGSNFAAMQTFTNK